MSLSRLMRIIAGNRVSMTRDLTRTLEELGKAAWSYVNPPMLQLFAERSFGADLAVAAISFTIQLAIELGRDPIEMRGLEFELIATVAAAHGKEMQEESP